MHRANHDESFFTAALRVTLRPPKPSRQWLVISLAIIIATVLLCVLLAWLGVKFHNGRSWHHFQEKRAGTFANVAMLFACAGVCLQMFRKFRGDSFALFWLVHVIAFIFLGLDDLMKIHEQLDYRIHKWLHRNPRDPITTNLDAVILVLYALLLIGVWWRYRWRVLSYPWMLLTMALAALGFAAMVVADTQPGWATLEESIKLITSAIILCALLSAAMSTDARKGSGIS